MSELVNQTDLAVEPGCPERYHLGDELTRWERWVPTYAPVFPNTVGFETIQSRLAVAGFYVDDSEELVELSRLSTGEVSEARGDKVARLRNPLGRTGLAGTGTLWRAGENITADVALLRRHPHDGIQIAMVFNRGKWHVPGGFAKHDREIESRFLVGPRELQEETGLDVYQMTLATKPEVLVPPGPKPRSRRSADWAWVSNHVDLYLMADWREGEDIEAGSDAEATDWTALDRIESLRRTGVISPDHYNYARLAFKAASAKQF